MRFSKPYPSAAAILVDELNACRLTNGRPVIRKASAHGLGHLRAPYPESGAPKTIPAPSMPLGKIGVERWQYDLWYQIIVAALEGHSDQVNLDYHSSLNQPAASRAQKQAMLDAAEKDGTRVKPEYGSVWYHIQGADKDHLRTHLTIAIPGATTATTGIPDNAKQGGIWIMNAGTTTAHIMTPGE